MRPRTRVTIGSLWEVVYEKSIGTKMNDLDLRLEVVSRSCEPLRYIWRWASRKPLEIEAWFQRTINRKWHIRYRMVTWPMTPRDLERSNSWPQYAYSAISRTQLDLETVPKDHNGKWHMGYQIVTRPMTSRNPQRCCEAVRSAILATAWLLVLFVAVYQLGIFYIVTDSDWSSEQPVSDFFLLLSISRMSA